MKSLRPTDARVLDAISAEYDRKGHLPDVASVTEVTRIDRAAVARSLKSLLDLGLIAGNEAPAVHGDTIEDYELWRIEPTGAGRMISG